jgi:cell division transport system permease protein
MKTKSASKTTSIVSVILATTIVAMLLSAGILLQENLRRQEQKFRADLRLELFLRDDTTPAELRELTDQVKSLTGYESAENQNKAEAYARMQGTLGTQLLPSGGYNPFPNSLIVTFSPQAATFQNFQNAEGRLKSLRCVEGIRYPKTSLMSQENIYSFFNKTAFLLLLLVTAALFLVMWLGMRRITLVRREESRILVLLGANWKQIGLPLIGRGLTIGVISATAGLLLLYLFWHLSARLSLQLSFITGNGIALVTACSITAGAISAIVTARSQLK